MRKLNSLADSSGIGLGFEIRCLVSNLNSHFAFSPGSFPNIRSFDVKSSLPTGEQPTMRHWRLERRISFFSFLAFFLDCGDRLVGARRPVIDIYIHELSRINWELAPLEAVNNLHDPGIHPFRTLSG